MKVPSLKSLIGKPIQRDLNYQTRLFVKALDETILTDVVVEFGSYNALAYKHNATRYGRAQHFVPLPANKSKVKAYCKFVNAYLQFPRSLRVPGTTCICDIISTNEDKISGFWRVIKGTIRKEGSAIVVG